MDTLRLIGGAVVAYLGLVLVVGVFTVLPDVLFDFVSLATANATTPIVVVNIAIAVTAILVVALAVRKR